MRLIQCFAFSVGCVLMRSTLSGKADSDEVCNSTLTETRGMSLLATKWSVQSKLVKEHIKTKLVKKQSTADGAKRPTQRKTDVLIPKGCLYTFLDLGANSGDTVNAFLQAEGDPIPKGTDWRPKHPTIEGFDYSYFQHTIQGILKSTKSKLSDYCVVGVEANDAWRPHFAVFEASRKKEVRHLGMHSGLAVGLTDGPMNFQCGKVHPKWGSYADGQPDEEITRKNQYPCRIASRSLPSILQEIRGKRTKVLIVKIDVESMANKILSHFLRSGVLESLSSEGVRIHMLVDLFHLSDTVVAELKSFKRLDNVYWQSMTVGTKEQSLRWAENFNPVLPNKRR